ncbi:hypothetical protein TVAG_423530 [Trichomonas vaginalis G3]|uniref:Mitochondrial carrier protein n=1 Tax=Trichomonas vaginalis (strain ATCC PRA-98 / G3) TaxID=412133 RepID=A2DTJ1_TRIV3|nr:hypothetical protein TVAGG3_0593760 [Trichomonas vaginalis G3]EAY16300.1 hypothetical protein TVAG_423530 [Trichomonas vaginalis G3]KAI5523449.1 hypothetical protein TVAGG3_0593760 [Trichomonas vaginalis G3]|eukprot:XP_001328523.1 hypothetical protein [Trichomonas vaginalis G3]
MTAPKSFFKDMLKVYTNATLGDMFTQSVIHGLKGDAEGLKFGEALLHGMQTGTTFVAYPIAVHLLEKHSETFRHHYHDEDGCKVAAYVAGGIGAAGIVALVNYPLEKLRKRAQKEQQTETFRFYFAGQVGPNIGAAFASELIEPALPVFKNSLYNWARGQMLNASINLSATLGYAPFAAITGQSLSELFGGYVIDMFPSGILNDSVGYISSIW